MKPYALILVSFSQAIRYTQIISNFSFLINVQDILSYSYQSHEYIRQAISVSDNSLMLLR